mmetsp:Transcript_4527/g.13730  ORF Transcript_4527/g.13730 Transcript_4527/m.13730 type:complete len:206 (-) Transcript_4527:392-1009(-)
MKVNVVSGNAVVRQERKPVVPPLLRWCALWVPPGHVTPETEGRVESVAVVESGKINWPHLERHPNGEWGCHSRSVGPRSLKDDGASVRVGGCAVRDADLDHDGLGEAGRHEWDPSRRNVEERVGVPPWKAWMLACHRPRARRVVVIACAVIAAPGRCLTTPARAVGRRRTPGGAPPLGRIAALHCVVAVPPRRREDDVLGTRVVC